MRSLFATRAMVGVDELAARLGVALHDGAGVLWRYALASAAVAENHRTEAELGHAQTGAVSSR
jgi:hypothetical protein